MTAPDGGFYSATDADSKRPTASPRRARSSSGPRRRSGSVLGAGPDDRALHPLLRRHRGRKLRGREHPRRRRARRDASTPRWPPQRADALRGARRAGRRRCATTRSWRPGTASRSRRSRWAAGVRRAPLRRRRRARGGRSCSTRCGPAARLARSAKDGRAGAAGFLDDYAFVVRGAARSLRGDVRAALAARGDRARRRGRAAVRRSGGRLVHDRRRSRDADRAREAGLRRRRAVGDVGRAAQRPAPRDVHVATIAGARSPTAPSRRSRRR